MTSTASSAEPVGPVVAFVGLGAMGAPMVRRLAGSGARLKLHDIRAEVAEGLAEEVGATTARSAAEAGDGAQVAVTMVADHTVVRQVVMGEGGLAETLAPGSLVVDMSSSYPIATRALGEELGARQIALVDAPVSGGVKRAVAGSLAIMLGGDDAAALDRAQPLLSAMGTVYRTGPLGSGHALKALNNFVSSAGLAAACEAVLVGRRFGLDPAVVVDVLNASTGRNNATENKLAQFILNEDFGSGFAMALMAKDVGFADQLAGELGCEAPTLSAMRALWRDASTSLGTGADHTEIIRHLAARGGGA
ncbi:NAD(P)-dependent oxidoreductase [Acuticoccus sp.]|uniref:NAD(P)-dependent oxidoreductase n=1 Tax=Acuticoccus sp. TaxID=1904378 RepID=UPI003B528A6D